MVNTLSQRIEEISPQNAQRMAEDALKFMSVSGTNFGRDTHYSSKEEMFAEIDTSEENMFIMDRSLFACILCLGGVTENSIKRGVIRMLQNPWTNGLLTPLHEKDFINYMVENIQPNRMIKLFVELKDNKINNARMRKTVLPHILNSRNLEWWSVKYRAKMKTALTHCWNVKTASIISKICAKSIDVMEYNEKEILNTYIDKFLSPVTPEKRASVYECLAFIFKTIETPTMELFVKFQEAKTDFSKAAGLPKETIEGIRSTFHKDVSQADVLKLSERSMTSKQKVLVQNKAKKEGVTIEFDPMRANLIDLYIYAFKMGFNAEINRAIKEKARIAAQSLPFNYRKAGILIDDSFSMSGSDEQKSRALAITYGMAAMLREKSEHRVATASGIIKDGHCGGSTNLAKPFIDLLEQDCDVIYIISDGYENAPAGRLAEVISIVRNKLNMDIPIYHFNPVGARKAGGGLKELAKGVAPIPVSNPAALGITLYKSMLEADPKKGIEGIMNLALPLIERRN